MTVNSPTVSRGRPTPLGVTPDGGSGERGNRPGVNVAVWAPEATSVEFCVFVDGTVEASGGGSGNGGGTSGGVTDRHVGNGHRPETELRIPLPYRDGGIRYAHIGGFGPGTRYGLRVDGNWDPVTGRYSNAAKLLLDPCARIIESPVRWHPLMSAFTAGGEADLRDSAPVVPKCVVPQESTCAGGDPDPASNRPGSGTEVRDGDLIIYEAHVKGMSAAHPDVPPALRGTYAGMGHPAVVDHMRRLGVTAVELLPVQTFIDDRFLANRGFTNYWGYQPVSWFSAEPRYATDGTGATADRELRTLVHTLHDAGIEVILDVVYNHSGEGDELGPTVSLRGFDNSGYYRMDRSSYTNDTGTGNTLAVHHPQTLRLVTDSLRHWVTHFGVDGFRFDLGAVLGRTGPDATFDPAAAFFQTVAQDPVLSGVRLIAEPWDIGDGGYRLGQFPWPWSEWNDRFRDGIRRLWRGETPGDTDLGSLLLGSADLFDVGAPGSPRRAATASVNFLAAHDGFTLADVVSYSRRHNNGNGENGRDGHGENYSDNLGVEGPTEDPGIVEKRARRVRGLLSTLLLAQGTPMLLAGDELGNSQNGNNNTYVQDNEVGWVDWAGADAELTDFTRRLIALRHRLPVLRQTAFRHGGVRTDGLPDVSWYRADGAEAVHEDWHDPDRPLIAAMLRGTAGDLFGEAVEGVVLVVINPGGDASFVLPDNGGPVTEPMHRPWRLELDSARTGVGGTAGGVGGSGSGSDPDGPAWDGTGTYPVLAQSVVVFSAP